MQTSLHWSELASNLGQALAGLAVVVGGAWALVTFRNAKRSEAATRLFQVFNRFQVGKAFKKAKIIFDFEYQDVVEPVVGHAVFYGTYGFTRKQREQSVLIDRVLNYLEHLMYMKANGHVTDVDCEAYFGYWLGLLDDPRRGALRRYLVRFEYDRLAAHVGTHEHEYLIAYGTLLSDEPTQDELDVRSKLTSIGTRTIRGVLYDLGEYPGFVEEGGPRSMDVEAELFRIDSPDAIHELDRHEEYVPTDPRGSLYIRRTIRLPLEGVEPRPWWRRRGPTMVDAWLYEFNGSVEDPPVIASGSWLRHTAARQTAGRTPE